MFSNFRVEGRASFVLDGQWGSAGKGAAVASLAYQLIRRGEAFDVIATNNGAQSGHTSVHDGRTRVAFHLPTAAIWAREMKTHPLLVYLNGGAVIDPDVLKFEIEEFQPNLDRFRIHPNAAVITQDCKDAEGRADSAQTKIASTRKGVGEALARKVLRSGMIAKDHPYLRQFVERVDLNDYLRRGLSVLVEVPQGHGLSLDGPFYPHCTSRNCTVGQAMSDAGIHPQYYGRSMLVLRTFPIRVGNIPSDFTKGETGGHSGGHYPDQRETSWDKLGIKAEITTVTKRVRRVFTFSRIQAREAMAAARPDVIYLTFCDYVKERADLVAIVDVLREDAARLGLSPEIVYQFGPSTADLQDNF